MMMMMKMRIKRMEIARESNLFFRLRKGIYGTYATELIGLGNTVHNDEKRGAGVKKNKWLTGRGRPHGLCIHYISAVLRCAVLCYMAR